MTSARKKVLYREIDTVPATYKIDNSTITYDSSKGGGSAQVGLAVNLSASGTVQLVSDAETVLGRLVMVDADNFATVQVDGYAMLPKGNGATVTPGTKIVGALGPSSAKGYVRNVAVATLAEVAVAVGMIQDTSSNANVILDAGTAVAGVVVLL